MVSVNNHYRKVAIWMAFIHLGCQSIQGKDQENLGDLPVSEEAKNPESPSVDPNLDLKKIFVQRDDKPDMLFTPCEPVAEHEIKSPRIQTIIAEMKTRLPYGIGLAANQIGHHLQIFMIEFSNENPGIRSKGTFDDVPFQIFINPKITARSREMVSFWHGCLSAVNSERGQVATWARIEYEAYDENGNLKKGTLSSLAAVIFQHELRHLLGKTYVEQAKEFKDLDGLRAEFAAGKTIMAPCGDEVPHLLPDYHVDKILD